MTEKKNVLKPAGFSIPAVLSAHHLLLPYRLQQAKANWAEIMGEPIAKYSYICGFQDTTVTVAVLNSVWMNQLFMFKESILIKLNEFIGEAYLQDVSFRKSGKKPKKIVYEWKDGEAEAYIPKGTLKNIALDATLFDKIEKETAVAERGIRDKIIRLRCLQERRKILYGNAGFKKCRSCGRWIETGEERCRFCKAEEKRKQQVAIRSLLEDMPWLKWDDIKKGDFFSPCKVFEENYNTVRRNMIYQLIDKVYHGYDREDEDLVLALLITQKEPAALSVSFIQNLVAKYRRKEDVSSYRRQSND